MVIKQTIVLPIGHGCERISPAQPRVSDRTNRDAVMGHFNFDVVIDATLFQEQFRNTDSLGVADFNDAGSNGRAHGWLTLTAVL